MAILPFILSEVSKHLYLLHNWDAPNHSLDKYIGKIRVRNLTFSLDDKIEDAGNKFLTKLFS
ncbi:MAG: hypothetical protein PT116_18675 [Aphanizomenon gracile PMC638.10]|nr:hypothetical protein [Aphanizomenon gracile PMC638.10]